MPPTQRMISKIFAAQREVGWDREQLYDVVEQVSGTRSVRSLSLEQAGAVIDVLVRAGARAPKKMKPRGRRTAPNEVLLVTGEQRDAIESYRARLGGRWTEGRYFEGACMRLIRKPRPRTAGDAARVIEMLKQRVQYEANREGKAQ